MLPYNLAEDHTSTVGDKKKRKKKRGTNLGEDLIKEFRQYEHSNELFYPSLQYTHMNFNGQ